MSSPPAQHAFALAYQEHLGWMLNTVRRLGVQAPDAEDVAHDVFSTAWRRLDTWVPERPMRPWLFGIAFRVVSNRKSTRSGTEVLSETLDELKGTLDRPDEVLEGEATRRHVLAALKALPIDQRAVFVGHDIERTPITELAEALEIPLNTAYSRLRLARQRFQSIFSGLQNEVRA
jgi:RNA polymerase sigma-70 factor, ECF subfamily